MVRTQISLHKYIDNIIKSENSEQDKLEMLRSVQLWISNLIRNGYVYVRKCCTKRNKKKQRDLTAIIHRNYYHKNYLYRLQQKLLKDFNLKPTRPNPTVGLMHHVVETQTGHQYVELYIDEYFHS